MTRGIAFLVWMLLTVAAIAQQADGTYRLRQEDVVRIQVFGQQQIQADTPVGQDGNISAPFIGSIRAEGKTVAELEADLIVEYRRKVRLRDPRVSVVIVQFRPIRATVGGAVNRPGTYQIRRGDTLISLLNQGGGTIQDQSALRRTFLRKSGSREVIPIDLYAMLVRGDMTQNYEIEDGDELTVPREEGNVVLVQGAVTQPGPIQFREAMTLADAIISARGEIRYRSRLSRVIIVRQVRGAPGRYLRINADYVRFIRKGDETQNVRLMPGDLVYVPETNTPDFQQIQAFANVAFILDRLGGGIFGLNIFGGN